MGREREGEREREEEGEIQRQEMRNQDAKNIASVEYTCGTQRGVCE